MNINDRIINENYKTTPIQIWQVEFEDGFLIDVIWLKEFKEFNPDAMFGKSYVSAIEVSRGHVNPTHLMYTHLTDEVET